MKVKEGETRDQSGAKFWVELQGKSKGSAEGVRSVLNHPLKRKWGKGETDVGERRKKGRDGGNDNH